MNPRHIDNITDPNRRAVAPYNFVELPEKVVDAQELPSGDRYHLDRHTGKIECTLTTESPLYTRCGWSLEDFAEHGEKAFNDLPPDLKQQRSNFFINPATKQPVIPGSSIRGMLRTLVEIISFGKIDRVSDQQKFFFRAVAGDKDDPLREKYKKYIKAKNIKAGYLLKKPDGWFIRPAMLINNNPFVWVKEDTVKSISDLILMKDLPNYKPQYFINISFEDINTKDNRSFAEKVSKNCTTYHYTGVLLTSGNMLEGGTNAEDLRRKNHCIIRQPNPNAEIIPISENAIRDYCSALTPFQKQEPPFDENKGVLKNGRCIFYCQPEVGKPVTLFGQSPNFRIPFSPQKNEKASTARDFIPCVLKDSQDKTIITDIAEAIFGFVRRDKQPENIEQSHSGRVFITDAKLHLNQDEKIKSSLNKNSQEVLLSSPKPTTFQHYLVQTSEKKSELKHYASQPPTDTQEGETLIRGHKLYWHKEYKKQTIPENADTQISLVKPIDSGIKFGFGIYFENLTDVELGALLWVLDLAQNDEYRLSLGMGKPLGLGAVKVEPTLYLNSRQNRYKKLFDSNDFWEKGETKSNTNISSYISKFESYVLGTLHHTGDFKKICRIQMLLAMLSWPGITDVENNTRYMEIKREKTPKIGDDPNEYKHRPVLPNPLDVMRQVTGIKIECDRPSPDQTFSEGQIIDAKVVNVEVKESSKRKTTITYEIQGSDCHAKEEIYKKEILLKVNDTLKVRIDTVKGKSIRKVNSREL